MNINVEQILIIILIVFLLYFVMNKCSCNIEGIDTCPNKKVDACSLHYEDCDNLFTEGEYSGFHKCTYPVSHAVAKILGLPSWLDKTVDAVERCTPDISADCKISNPCSVWGTCVDVRSFGAKIGDTRRIAGKDEAGVIRSVDFNYYKPKVNKDDTKNTAYLSSFNNKEYATIVYRYESDNGFYTEERYDGDGRWLWDTNSQKYVKKGNTDEDKATWEICKSLFEKLNIVYFSIYKYNSKFRFEVQRYFKKASTIRMLDGSGDYYDLGYSNGIGMDEDKTLFQTNWVDFTSDNSKIEFLVLK